MELMKCWCLLNPIIITKTETNPRSNNRGFLDTIPNKALCFFSKIYRWPPFSYEELNYTKQQHTNPQSRWTCQTRMYYTWYRIFILIWVCMSQHGRYSRITVLKANGLRHMSGSNTQCDVVNPRKKGKSYHLRQIIARHFRKRRCGNYVLPIKAYLWDIHQWHVRNVP